MAGKQQASWAATLENLPRLDPDLALVRQFRATGRPAVFEVLFRKYHEPVFRLVNRMVHGEEAYDLTQDVFIRALKSLHTFKGDCKFSTWLFTIAKNTCLNHIRDTRSRGQFDAYSIDQPAGSENDLARDIPCDTDQYVPHLVEVRDLQRAVDGVLMQLAPEARMALTLRDFEQLSYDEIAQIMGWTLPNVKSKIHRARMEFKKRFQPYLEMTECGDGACADVKQREGVL